MVEPLGPVFEPLNVVLPTGSVLGRAQMLLHARWGVSGDVPAVFLDHVGFKHSCRSRPARRLKSGDDSQQLRLLPR